MRVAAGYIVPTRHVEGAACRVTGATHRRRPTPTAANPITVASIYCQALYKRAIASPKLTLTSLTHFDFLSPHRTSHSSNSSAYGLEIPTSVLI